MNDTWLFVVLCTIGTWAYSTLGLLWIICIAWFTFNVIQSTLCIQSNKCLNRFTVAITINVRSIHYVNDGCDFFVR